MMKNNKRSGYSILLLGTFFIGFSPILMRLTDVSSSAAAFWRTFLAFPILLPFLLISIQKTGETFPKGKALGAVILAGVAFGVDLFFWHWSVAETTVANSTFLANLAALFTALISVTFLGQKASGSFFLGLFTALMGAGLMASASAALRPEYLFGDMLSIFTALAYAIYILAAARARQHVSTLMLMTFGSLVTSITLLPPALLDAGPFLPAALNGWGWLVLLCVVSHVLGQSLIAFGLMQVPATLASLTFLVQPVIAASIAWILFAEVLGALEMSGGLLVLFGVGYAKYKDQQATARRAAEAISALEEKR